MKEYELFRDGEKIHFGSLTPERARKMRAQALRDIKAGRYGTPTSTITIRDANTREIVKRIIS